MAPRRRTTVFAAALAALAAATVAAEPVSIGLGRMPHREVARHRTGHTLPVANDLRELLPRERLLGDSGANGTAGLYGGILELGEFFAVVEIGPNKQEFRVQVDTGSSTLAVPLADCRCGTHPDLPFTVNATTTVPLMCDDKACKFQVGYLDGSGMNGRFFNETLGLGGLSAVGPFGGMEWTSKGFEKQTDGILGAAYSNLNCFSQDGERACHPTILDTLIGAGQMDNKFGMCLNDNHGRWDLGHFDAQYADDDFAWAAQTPSWQSGFYAVAIQGITVGTSTVTGVDDQSVVVDSGTTLAALPSDTFNDIVQLILNSNAPGAGTYIDLNLGGSCGALTPEELAQWPDIEYTLTGSPNGVITVSLPASRYLLEINGVRCFALQAANTGGQHILGDIFMSQYYVAFDREGDQVGFAPVKNCDQVGTPNTPSGPWTGRRGGGGGGGSNTVYGIVGALTVVAGIAIVFLIVRSRRARARSTQQPLLTGDYAVAPSGGNEYPQQHYPQQHYAQQQQQQQFAQH